MAPYLLPALLRVTYEREAFLSMFKRPVDTSGGCRPWDKESGGEGGEGGFGLQENFFSALWASVWSKIGGCCSPGPSPRSATGRNFLRLCSHYGEQLFVSSVNTYRICDFPFRDRCVAAYLRFRNRAEITVLMCEQKPYPVWFPCRRKSYPVECEHSLRMRSKICKSQLSNGKWSALNSCLNCKSKAVFDRLYCYHGNRKWS